MTQGTQTTPRRLDRLRRNPFVVVVIGFLVLFGGLEGAAAGLTNALGGAPWAILLTAVVIAPLAVFVYWGLITRFLEGRRSAPELAVTRRTPRLIALGLGLSLAVMAIAYSAIALIGGVSITSAEPWASAVATSLGLALIAGVVEELFLRGVLFRVTEQYLGSWLSLVVSAAFFGLLHLANPDASWWAGVAIALEAGVSLAALFVLTRSLWAVIAMHVGWNLSESLLGVPVSGREPSGIIATSFHGPDWLTGGQFGIEASVVVVALWLIVSAALLTVSARRGMLIAPRWRERRTA